MKGYWWSIGHWFSEAWDDLLVYAASVVGSLCALWWVADNAGAKFSIKLGYVIIAGFLAILGMGLLEYFRHKAAAEKGSLAQHLLGKKARVLPRVGASWAMGFIIQLAFQPIVENLLAFLVGFSKVLLPST